MGSRFVEEDFGEEKTPLATTRISNPGFLRLCTTDKYNTDQMKVELFLISFENKVMLDTLSQKTF